MSDTPSIFGGASPGSPGALQTKARVDPRHYERYEHRYNNRSDLYTKLGMMLKQPDLHADVELKSALKSLRNPVHRVVEFYATVLLSGTAEEALPLRTSEEGSSAGDPRNGNLARAIKLIWAWSNLDQRKQVLKRYVAIYGQCFIKVVSPRDASRVHFQLIKPASVTDFDKDDRGNITYMRLDSPFEKEEGQPPRRVKKVHTEIWRKVTKDKGSPGYYRTWERASLEDSSTDTVPTERALGTPATSYELSTRRGLDSGTLGFDFVPFVDVSAMDTGEKRPKPIYEHALALIDEQNRMATRHHDLLFRYNKPFKAVQGIGNDASGRPIAPPQIGNLGGDTRSVAPPEPPRSAGFAAHLLGDSRDDLSLGGDILFGLPGNAQLTDVTPNLNFEAARSAILDMATELREELPELIYYELKDRSELSGRAIRLLLAGAVDRASEMRANIQTVIIKADKMALTIAQVRGLPGFGPSQIGTYNRGEGFRHEFEPTDILPVSELEKEETRARKIENAQKLVTLGLTREQAMKEVGLNLGVAPEDSGTGEDFGGDELTRAAAALAKRMAPPSESP